MRHMRMWQCSRCLLVGLVLSGLLSYETFATDDCEGLRDFGLNNKTSREWMIRDEEIETKADCKRFCDEEPACVSYMVNMAPEQGPKQCRLHGAKISIYSALDLEEGAETYDMACRVNNAYGVICSDDSGCQLANSKCILSVCQCDHGWSYSPKDRRCVRECAKYGSKFTKFTNSFILFRDEVVLRDPYSRTAKGCAAACEKQRKFTCRSFELTKKECRLQSVTSFDETATFHLTSFDADLDYYQRQCTFQETENE